jgi:Icc protein
MTLSFAPDSQYHPGRMKILALDDQPIYQLPYTSAASGGGVETRVLPLLTGTVDVLSDELSALLITSDLQGVAPSSDEGGALALLGEVLANDLRGLDEAELIPARGRIGVLLAGDLFSSPGGDKRGATGDVRPVWAAFGREARWVAGVAGNHDLFGTERDRERFIARSGAHLLDGHVVEVDGLRLGGVSGIIGNPNKPARRSAGDFLDLIEQVLAQRPDLLILHEGPDDPNAGAMGNPDIRALLTSATEAEGVLVICGHSPWRQPLAPLDGGGQVLNVHERAVLLQKRP